MYIKVGRGRVARPLGDGDTSTRQSSARVWITVAGAFSGCHPASSPPLTRAGSLFYTQAVGLYIGDRGSGKCSGDTSGHTRSNLKN